MNKRTFTPAQLIERAANSQLSNFGGNEDDFVDYEGEESLGNENSSLYIGEGDGFVDFGGPAKSFAEALDRNRVFNVNISNNHATKDLEVVLFPGLTFFSKVPDGMVREGVFQGFDGGVLEAGPGSLNGSGSPESLDLFYAYIQQFPTTILGFKVSGNNALQIEQPFEIIKESPFKKLESKNIYPAAYTDETANKDKVATVPERFFANNQTRVNYLVLANTKVTFTFFIGASLSTGQALETKTQKAARNLITLGGSGRVSTARKISRRA